MFLVITILLMLLNVLEGYCFFLSFNVIYGKTGDIWFFLSLFFFFLLRCKMTKMYSKIKIKTTPISLSKEELFFSNKFGEMIVTPFLLTSLSAGAKKHLQGEWR